MNGSGVLRKILRFVRPYAGLLLLSLLFALLSVALTLYAPVLTGRAIDAVVAKGDVDFGVLAVVLKRLATVVAGAAAAQWMMTLCTNKVAFKTVADLRNKAFRRLENVPLKYIDTHPHGDILNRVVTDVDQISDGLLMGFTQLFTGVVTVSGTLGFMLSINLKITLVVVLVTPLSLFAAHFIAKRTFSMFKKRSETNGELTALISESVGNQKLVKAFGYESELLEKFEKINTDLRRFSLRAVFFSSITNPSTRFVNGVVYTCVGIIGAFAAIAGVLTVGQLSCFLTYANQYTKPFNEISGVVAELQSALAAAARLFEVIEEDVLPPDDPDAKILTKAEGRVTLSDVAFSYLPEVPLIENLNLNVLPGQRIALVGPTGCGKTTLINLLMRFYDVNGGVISVDDIPVGDIAVNSLRASFGMVLQETWLKKGTVRENIAYGKPDATEEEIVEAAKAAFADGFIRRLPDGYDTVIAEDGGNLSQGQKQLLCIARVMLSRPPMLILDEATSSIDTRTEIHVQNAFAKMMRGRTGFIVAHRLSTIKEADCILVMKSGRIVEQGKHEDLLSKGGFYADLYNSQFATA